MNILYSLKRLDTLSNSFQHILGIVISKCTGKYQSVIVEGRLVNNIRCGDDTVIIANDQEGLQSLIDAITKNRDLSQR